MTTIDTSPESIALGVLATCHDEWCATTYVDPEPCDCGAPAAVALVRATIDGLRTQLADAVTSMKEIAAARDVLAERFDAQTAVPWDERTRRAYSAFGGSLRIDGPPPYSVGQEMNAMDDALRASCPELLP